MIIKDILQVARGAIVSWLPDALMVAGGAAIAVGAGMIYFPAGWIAAGVFSLVAGWILARGGE